ncbi:MAG: class I SAM-dependent rRNA methyltransferase [Deltaproteobacteria bacterium]|nr:class I SAM-dependent rRNA methyltransferase [Deltaproteobacteria bacterium]MBW2254239.1 class I SAM-dependent rRNA methyltransferase [Deltaproteobacteria bacterium]
MSQKNVPPSVRLSPGALSAVRVGHPWVYREGRSTMTPGTVVRLVDDHDRAAGWGLADEGDIAVRVLGRGEPPTDGLRAVLHERVRRADAFRWRIAPPETDCWRVVAGAGDGLPGLVVDRYGSLAVLRVYALGWEPHLPRIVDAITSTGWAETVYRRFGVRRVDDRRGGVTLWGQETPDALVVSEHGMKLLVRPGTGQKTGLFLDQREHRLLVRRWAPGRRVANLFAYNGGFSVAAALGGAATVITVDLSPDAVEDARENFRLNDLDPAGHEFQVRDVFQWTPEGTVDLLVVDPPALAHGKRSEATAARAYRKLHRRLGKVVGREGLLATSSCTAHLSLPRWREALREGLADHGDWSWHWVSTEPPDHPVALAHEEGNYLKFALLRRR